MNKQSYQDGDTVDRFYIEYSPTGKLLQNRLWLSNDGTLTTDETKAIEVVNGNHIDYSEMRNRYSRNMAIVGPLWNQLR